MLQITEGNVSLKSGLQKTRDCNCHWRAWGAKVEKRSFTRLLEIWIKNQKVPANMKPAA